MNSFQLAISKFDAYNSEDPNKEVDDGQLISKELLYSRRMSECLAAFAPDAPEEVKLAARCQHIGRWQIPRTSYPEGRKGYLQWRNKLKDMHADIAGEMLVECGYPGDMIDKVRFLLLKKDIYHNKGTQLLEDVVCLVFVRYYLADFAAKHERSKVIDIIRKTLKKMSPAAQKEATAISLDESARSLLEEATAG